MNTDTGEFVGEDQAEPWMEKVSIGEVVPIKGNPTEVVRIEGRELTLKLMSIGDRHKHAMEELGMSRPRNRHDRRKIEKLARRK